MTIHYTDDQMTVHHGDCLDVLRELPDASVDAVVCDPPYGLAELPTQTVTTALTAWLTGNREHIPDGRGFMNRDWDRFVPPPAAWDECYRVLKPGGHLLAFAGSRTADLMGISVRLAGFDIRDSISWIYGNGFPKSLNVSEAIDKHRASRGSEPVDEIRSWLNARRIEAGLSLKQVNEALGAASNGGGLASSWMTNPTSKGMPDWDQWCALKTLLHFGDDMDGSVRTLHATAAGRDRPVVSQGHRIRRESTVQFTCTSTGAYDIKGFATTAAARWTGWGTALKPAQEPIVVARKPIAGTVAANVTTHGTGALNIDACRTPAGQDYADKCASVVGLSSNRNGDAYGEWAGIRADSSHEAGRWPTNAVLDDQAARYLDQQTRGRTSRHFPVFQYQAKADAGERPCVDGVAHPTVKPIDLIRWLVRLVTPPGGTVLDPFAGSGTTAEACMVEGFNCIAIEREADYLPLIMARLAKPIQSVLFGDLDGVA